MSGEPNETELQAQWDAAVDLLDQTRAFSDGTVAVLDGTGLLDVLEQSLKGQYTPANLANAAASFRATLSSLADQGRALEFLSPILFDYGLLISEGGGYTDLGRLSQALYEHFVKNDLSVQSRAISYDTTATTGKWPGDPGTITGNGSMTRLTVDANAFNMEACFVETKRWRCRRDQNTGAQEHAEEWECLGLASSPDALLRQNRSSAPTFGSGTRSNRTIRSLHAGTSAGGSLLRNSSFDSYDSAVTENKFVGWDQSYTTMTASGVTQDTTNYYRGSPGTASGSEGSLKLTVSGGGSNKIVMTQTLANMRTGRLNSALPYFLRVMWNGTPGSAVGGTIKLRLGSTEVTVAVAQSGWQELLIPADADTWFQNFNQDDFGIDIEWYGGTSGYVVFDDVIFAPYELVDGTFWALRGGTTSWLVDDTLTFTDTGGLPSVAKIQWWYWVAGLGYLPSAATPTFADP